MREKNNVLECRILFILIIVFAGCNPYKGFTGVNPKGMKKNKLPSTELREDYDKKQKKMSRKYQKEMKKRTKEMGTETKK